MGYFEQITTVNRAAVRCGTHDKSLHDKKFILQDAADFTQQVISEIDTNETKLELLEIAGILTWTTVIVTDIIQDATQVTPTGKGQKIALGFLEKMRQGAAKEKFNGNRYKQEIDRIDQVGKVLKEGWPGGKDVINTFTNLAKNTYGLADNIESSAELRQSNVHQKRLMTRQLKALLKQLRQIEQEIRDDSLTDDGQTGVRMSIAPAKQLSRMP